MVVTEKKARGSKESLGMYCPYSMGCKVLKTCIGSLCMAWKWTTWDHQATGLFINEPVGYCGFIRKSHPIDSVPVMPFQLAEITCSQHMRHEGKKLSDDLNSINIHIKGCGF